MWDLIHHVLWLMPDKPESKHRSHSSGAPGAPEQKERKKKKKTRKKNTTQAPESLRPLATSWHYSLCLHVLWTQICLSSHQLSETSALTTTGLFSLQHSTKKLEQLSRKTWVYERSETVSNGEGASLGHGHEGGSNLMPCASQQSGGAQWLSSTGSV